MNAKIKRNFQVFSACDFIAAITQHISDKRFQMVRYYGWYSNKMRGQRRKRAEEAACESAAAAQQGCGALASAAVEIIEHRALKPRHIPSRSWRELIKKVWEVDPLLCPMTSQCHHEMRIVSLINDAQIIERILRHVGSGGVDQWVNEIRNHGVRIAPSTGPPVGESVAAARIIDRGQLVIEPWLDDQMPDYDCGI